MIPLAEFMSAVREGETPQGAPDGCSPQGMNWPLQAWPLEYNIRIFEERQIVQGLGMYGIVYRQWVEQLAEWIGGRLVLEVMAGRGWLAKALMEREVAVLPTDDHSWAAFGNFRGDPVTWMGEWDAVEASGAFPEAEVLLCSWPYMDDTMARACAAWGSERPIVYIGEGANGCTADEAFFEGFVADKDAPEIELMTWPGTHDTVQIGHWRG